MAMELQNGDIAVSLSASVASAMASLLPLASVSQRPYVSGLLSFTLDRLHKEPELLRVDTERIQRQMLEVAVHNYRAFISAADALVAIKEEVSSINKHLELMECLASRNAIAGVSVAMNELRACALVSLKKVLAQELIKGLHAVSDSLLRYNATRMLRENESGLFLVLCQAFIEVAFPHSATCFGRCYPGGAALVMDAKNLYDGFSRLSTIASLKEPSKPISNVEEKTTSENGDFPQAVMENGVEPTGAIDETRISNADKEIEQSHFAD